MNQPTLLRVVKHTIITREQLWMRPSDISAEDEEALHRDFT